MTMRHTRTARRATALAALTAGLVLAVAGCGGGDGGEGDGGKSPAATGQDHEGGGQDSGGSGDSGDSGGGRVLAQVKGGKDGRLTLTVTSAERDDAGFATFRGTLRNDGASVAVLPGWASDENELKDNGLSMAGATMVDQKGKKRYLILRDTSGHCLCTRFSGGFPKGESIEWYAQFPAPPASTTSVDFQVADLPAATVELSGE